jgi:hypothetical protein
MKKEQNKVKPWGSVLGGVVSKDLKKKKTCS